MKNYKWIASLVIVCALAMPQRLMALGECGLSCCIASAGTSGIGLASNFGLSVQYEYSNMGRLMNGKDEVSVKQVLDKHFPATGMARYMVPTEHIMQKISVSGAYTVNDKLQILGVVPFVINDMKMKMRMRMNPMMPMMIMERDTVMDTISGLGDISLIAQWNVFQDQEIRPTSRLTLGGGVKLATGANDAESSPGVRIHAVMQAGTGSTDPILTLNYMKAFYPLVLQFNAFYEMSTEGKDGYEFGDQFAWDVTARYGVLTYFNLGLGLNGISSTQDKDHKGVFARPMMSMLDTPAYSGLHSYLATLALQVKIPNTAGSAEIKVQLPVYQSVGGYQQVLENRLLASTTWVF